jgi:hypothetical protein
MRDEPCKHDNHEEDNQTVQDPRGLAAAIGCKPGYGFLCFCIQFFLTVLAPVFAVAS